MPAGFVPPVLTPSMEDAAQRAAGLLLDPQTSEAAEDCVRVLAGIGPGAAPHVVRSLGGASWHARAALVTAIAEMDAPGLTPLLAEASRDPCYAVREAAVTGLGKTGDARGAAAIAER